MLSGYSCSHLGPPTGQLIDCVLCGGRKQIAIHSCDLHGHCTPHNSLVHRLSGFSYVVPWCRTCPDNPDNQKKASGLQGKLTYAFEGGILYQKEDRVGIAPGTYTYSGCTVCCGVSGFAGCNCICSGTLLPDTIYVDISGSSLPGECTLSLSIDGTYTLLATLNPGDLCGYLGSGIAASPSEPFNLSILCDRTLNPFPFDFQITTSGSVIVYKAPTSTTNWSGGCSSGQLCYFLGSGDYGSMFNPCMINFKIYSSGNAGAC